MLLCAYAIYLDGLVGRVRLGVCLRGNCGAGKRTELGWVKSGENAVESDVQSGGYAVGPQ